MFYARKISVLSKEKEIESEVNVKLKVCEYSKGKKKDNDSDETYNIIDEYDSDEDNHDYTIKLEELFDEE